ncbi:MAG: hypothetical protein ABIH65_00760 [Nanoarchaeota archaeon]
MLQQTSLQDCKALSSYIESSNSFYQDLLGYKPEQTSLQEINESEWKEFVKQRGLNSNSSGIYLPRNQTAIIREENPLSLFHEYFGHGLFCEQTLIGRKLVDLEKKLLKEEKQEFNEREFVLDDINKFRQQNQTFQELEEFRKQNLARYELFAIWTEYLLSKEFGLRDDFERRYDILNKESKEVIDSITNFSKWYGNLATFYEFGLRKIQDKKRLIKLSQDLFNGSLNRTRLILHFGSKKPFSDIDLFMASNDIPPSYDSWLDVRAYKFDEIESGVNALNPMITYPIMIGDLVFGKEEYLRELKRKILAQPITEEAIAFSLKEHEAEKRRSKDESLGDYLQSKNLRSNKIFLTNALALKNGYKLLTVKELIKYSRTLLSSGKFIELKGGIE